MCQIASASLRAISTRATAEPRCRPTGELLVRREPGDVAQLGGDGGAQNPGDAGGGHEQGHRGVVGAEVTQLDSLSAHADRDELLAWIGALPSAPQRVFVTHGEPVAADALRQAIEERHRWPCTVPEYRDTVEL